MEVDTTRDFKRIINHHSIFVKRDGIYAWERTPLRIVGKIKITKGVLPCIVVDIYGLLPNGTCVYNYFSDGGCVSAGFVVWRDERSKK
jgi:hypothetical protein